MISNNDMNSCGFPFYTIVLVSIAFRNVVYTVRANTPSFVWLHPTKQYRIAVVILSAIRLFQQFLKIEDFVIVILSTCKHSIVCVGALNRTILHSIRVANCLMNDDDDFNFICVDNSFIPSTFQRVLYEYPRLHAFICCFLIAFIGSSDKQGTVACFARAGDVHLCVCRYKTPILSGHVVLYMK
jgi:hypothetical protein